MKCFKCNSIMSFQEQGMECLCCRDREIEEKSLIDVPNKLLSKRGESKSFIGYPVKMEVKNKRFLARELEVCAAEYLTTAQADELKENGLWDEYLKIVKSVKPPKTCEWKMDEDGVYHTSCNETWYFPEPGIKENGVFCCHHCGGKVKLRDN